MEITKVYNLIILDKSGSMEDIRDFAIQGFNETVKTIKQSQAKFADTQEHYVSFVTFCNCGINTILDKMPVNKVRNLTRRDYAPCCGTPLFDAMGTSLLKLEKELKNKENYTVLVTIITDGYENSSLKFKQNDIAKLVEKLKKQGWMFAYMGADHDVEQVAMSISITNTIQFEKSEGGMQEMFERERNAKQRYYEEMNERRDEFAQMSEHERRMNYAEMSNMYFQQESAAKPQFTPDRIESLSANEVFVFGSDIAGRHNGGAARLAVSRFGAKVGQAVGLQGSSYAIPTVGVDMNFIKLHVKEFIEFAKANSNLTFYVTRIGCGVAGFVDEDIAPFFKDALMLENVILPEMFYKIAKCYC